MEIDINTKPLIRIGTRGSNLALAQANELQGRLVKTHEVLRQPNSIEIIVIKTTGDRVQDRSLAEIGGKGLFMKEIEEALLDKRIDLALHSMKDVETQLTAGTELACILPREEVNEAFLSNSTSNFTDLRYGCKIGTSSVRRAAFIKNKRPDIETILFRGNVETRLEKLDKGEVEATFLAVAGLKRLGLEHRITRSLSLKELPPAVAQGAIGAQCRTPQNIKDVQLWTWLRAVNHENSAIRVNAERAMLAALDGSCKTPIAGHAEIHGENKLTLTGYVLSTDGARLYKASGEDLTSNAMRLGQVVGKRLVDKCGSDLPRFTGK